MTQHTCIGILKITKVVIGQNHSTGYMIRWLLKRFYRFCVSHHAMCTFRKRLTHVLLICVYVDAQVLYFSHFCSQLMLKCDCNWHLDIVPTKIAQWVTAFSRSAHSMLSHRKPCNWRSWSDLSQLLVTAFSRSALWFWTARIYAWARRKNAGSYVQKWHTPHP